MVDFPDPTAFLQLINQRRQLQLQAEELEFRRQQERFDQEAELATREMKVREQVSRQILLDRDVELAQDPEHQEWLKRSLRANVILDERRAATPDFEDRPDVQALRFRTLQLSTEAAERGERMAADPEVEELLRREMRADVESREERVKQQKFDLQSQQRTDAIGSSMAAAYAGVQDSLGENPDTEKVAYVAARLGNLKSLTNKFFPGNTLSRAGLGKQSFFDVVSAPITEHIEGTLDRGGPESVTMAENVLGYGPHSAPLARFVPDSAFQKARAALGRAVDAIGAQVSALPNGKFLEDNLFSGGANFETALDRLKALQAEVATTISPLGRDAFHVDEVGGKTSNVLFSAEEKLNEYGRMATNLQAGIEVNNTGSGVFTESQRTGVDIMAQALTNEVFAFMNPGQAVQRLQQFVKNVGVYPRAQVTQVFDSAARSADPVSQLRASMVFDTLTQNASDQASSQIKTDLYNDVLSKSPDLLERLEVMSAIRRSLQSVEMAAMAANAAPAAGVMGAAANSIPLLEYATNLVEMTDRVMGNQKTLLAEEMGRQAGANVEEGEKVAGFDPFGNSEQAVTARMQAGLVVAGRFMGEDEVGGIGVLDQMDISRADLEDAGLLSQFKEEFWTEMANFTPDQIDGVSLTRRADKSGTEMMTRYHQGWLNERATRHHPIHIAKKFDHNANMSADLAGRIARYQLRAEFLSNVKTVEGEDARVRFEDVTYKPTVLADGQLAYYILTSDGKYLDVETGEVGSTPRSWYPEMSVSGLIQTFEETRPTDATEIGRQTLSGFGEFATLHRDLDRHLGVESPSMKARATRSAEKQLRMAEKRAEQEKPRIRRSGFGPPLHRIRRP